MNFTDALDHEKQYQYCREYARHNGYIWCDDCLFNACCKFYQKNQYWEFCESFEYCPSTE